MIKGNPKDKMKCEPIKGVAILGFHKKGQITFGHRAERK